MAQVKFLYGNHADYLALAQKDANTLYFIEDLHKLYKGDTLYGGGEAYVVVEGNSTDNVPATGEEGKLYIFTADHAIMRYTGVTFVYVIAPVATALEDGSTKIATAGLVKSYVDNAINGVNDAKADKATTLAGYGIADAYTKDEVDAKVTSVYKFKGTVENYAALTQKVDNVVGDVWNVKDTGINYAWAIDEEHPDGFWDDLGGVVDLSAYATTEFVNGLVSPISTKLDGHVADTDIHITAAERTEWNAKATTAQVATAKTEAINEAVTQAKAYADGLGANYATAEQGAKADSALQQADIVSGTTNGTISVKGTEVAVAGLGSAAYTEASAYDAVGAANNALTEAKAYTDTALTWNVIGA